MFNGYIVYISVYIKDSWKVCYESTRGRASPHQYKHYTWRYRHKKDAMKTWPALLVSIVATWRCLQPTNLTFDASKKFRVYWVSCTYIRVYWRIIKSVLQISKGSVSPHQYKQYAWRYRHKQDSMKTWAGRSSVHCGYIKMSTKQSRPFIQRKQTWTFLHTEMSLQLI